jgi:hypothetical protein
MPERRPAHPQLRMWTPQPLPHRLPLWSTATTQQQWQLNQPWQDNLGALFAHDGENETVYSTSTVDTTQPGTTTIDYWAIVPATQQWLHTTRDIVIPAPANDNPLPATNDNDLATTTAATSSAQ